jgi:hypothetical protein
MPLNRRVASTSGLENAFKHWKPGAVIWRRRDRTGKSRGGGLVVRVLIHGFLLIPFSAMFHRKCGRFSETLPTHFVLLGVGNQVQTQRYFAGFSN